VRRAPSYKMSSHWCGVPAVRACQTSVAAWDPPSAPPSRNPFGGLYLETLLNNMGP